MLESEIIPEPLFKMDAIRKEQKFNNVWANMRLLDRS